MRWDVGQGVRSAGVRPRSIAELLPRVRWCSAGALPPGRRFSMRCWRRPGPGPAAGAAAPLRPRGRDAGLLRAGARAGGGGPGAGQLPRRGPPCRPCANRTARLAGATRALVAGDGASGLADWAVEPLMPGAPAGGVDEPLMMECLDLLAALHALGGTASSLAGAGEVVARVCGAADAAAVRDTAARLDAELAGCRAVSGTGTSSPGTCWWRAGGWPAWWTGTAPGPVASRCSTCSTCWSPRAGEERTSPGVRRSSNTCCPGPAPGATRSPATTAGGSASTRSRHCSAAGRGLLARPGRLPAGTHAEYWEDGEWIEANVGAVARAIRE